MSLDSIKSAITSKVGLQILATQKHSPKILFVAGTVGVVTAAVLACRGTLKLDDVLTRGEAQRLEHDDLLQQNSTYTDEQHKRDIMKCKLQTGLEVAKLYAPAIIIGGASIAALTGSHVILNKRNGAVMAAYAGLDRAYKEYRQRVAAEFGADVDRKFAVGTGDQIIEEKLADGTIKKTVVQGKEGRFGGSPYAVVFDEHSKFFSREPGMNAMTIGTKQSFANDKLKAKGFLFLNDVYRSLGVPETKAGQCVGWVYRKDNETKTGDNYIDFGVFDGDPEIADAFVDGVQSRVVLDFNVDGVILDLI